MNSPSPYLPTGHDPWIVAASLLIATLAAFVAVCAAMLTRRVREPSRERKFTAPLPWIIGIVGIAGCLCLFASLPARTQFYFLIWNALGLVLYLLFASPMAEKARSARA